MDIQVKHNTEKLWNAAQLDETSVCNHLCFCVQEILNYINRKEFEPLLKVDQLNLEREKNKVFLRFGQYAQASCGYFLLLCTRP